MTIKKHDSDGVTFLSKRIYCCKSVFFKPHFWETGLPLGDWSTNLKTKNKKQKKKTSLNSHF